MEHTKGELTHYYTEEGDYAICDEEFVSGEGDGTFVGVIQTEANAERIVKCWNSYDKLVEALTIQQLRLEVLINFVPSGKARNNLTKENIKLLTLLEETK